MRSNIYFYVYNFSLLLITLLKIRCEKVKSGKRVVSCYLSYLPNQTQKTIPKPFQTRLRSSHQKCSIRKGVC